MEKFAHRADLYARTPEIDTQITELKILFRRLLITTVLLRNHVSRSFQNVFVYIFIRRV